MAAHMIRYLARRLAAVTFFILALIIVAGLSACTTERQAEASQLQPLTQTAARALVARDTVWQRGGIWQPVLFESANTPCEQMRAFDRENTAGRPGRDLIFGQGLAEYYDSTWADGSRTCVVRATAKGQALPTVATARTELLYWPPGTGGGIGAVVARVAVPVLDHVFSAQLRPDGQTAISEVQYHLVPGPYSRWHYEPITPAARPALALFRRTGEGWRLASVETNRARFDRVYRMR